MKTSIAALLLALACQAQPWSSILSTSRAIDWTQAGLPATLPDGETTPNPWTPPTRTQCGSTVNPSGDATGATDATNINTAMAACTPGHYVLLASGTFYIDTPITMYEWSGITLRGGGAQSTSVNLSGSAMIQYDFAINGGICTTWSSGFAAGTASITVSGCTGSVPHAGQIIELTQCDTGTSGSGCATGSVTDNGGLFMCGYNTVCQRNGEGTATGTHVQYQLVYMTAASGSAGSYTLNFTPGLYLSNWASGSSPTVTWQSGYVATNVPYGDGVEDLTLVGSTSFDGFIRLDSTYASWVKGVRFIGAGSSGGTDSLSFNGSLHCLVANNYFYREAPPPGSDFGAAIYQSVSSNNLVINNISDIDNPWIGFGSNSGNVVAFNYGRDAFTPYVLSFFEHQGGSVFELFEGNQTSQFQEDDTHGTHDLNTWFRNYAPCYDPPYSPGDHSCILFDDFARFENSVANVFGTAGLITVYEGTGTTGWVYRLGGGDIGDSLVKPTSLRWGNWDDVTNAVRWCGNSGSPGWSTTCSSTSEIPVSLASPNAAYSNPVPATTIVPPSFFLPTATHPNGGTGLSWWKVCTTWTSFPTGCGGTTVQPFPPIGPDVTGGSYGGAHAYDVPARLAWVNLPVDTTYQSSYTVTGSSWSGGVETLTISSPPNIEHLMGAFQLSGMNAACTSGAAFNTNGEILMTTSTSSTISYALTSNPGLTCTGTFKWPDVRQFDERVYQADALSPGVTIGSGITIGSGVTIK